MGSAALLGPLKPPMWHLSHLYVRPPAAVTWVLNTAGESGDWGIRGPLSWGDPCV